MTNHKTPASVAREADLLQDWARLSASEAFHLIERHADNWAHAGELMEAWCRARWTSDGVKANSERVQNAAKGELGRYYSELMSVALAKERRERIATAALQALITAGWESKDRPEFMATVYADALIAELDRERGG